MMRCLRSITAAVALACGAPAVADATVVLRGTGETIRAASVLGDSHGLEVRDASGKSTLIPWDMVREVDGATGVGSLGEYLDVGRDLWRARIRIERGDTTLAQPVLAKHWAAFRGADGPTAALVAEGLLRCALASGDTRAAADPWLACLRHRSAGIPSRFPELAPVIDAETGLLPELSPFMPASRRAEVIAACEASMSGPRGSSDAAEVATRIVRIARGEAPAGAPAGSATKAPAKSPDGAAATPSRAVQALALIEDIAAAADARALDRAVAAFDKAFEEAPSYLASWRLAAVGTARARMARADGAATGARGRAALELLAVPAAGLDRTGLVDAYALEEAAKLLRESGEQASAAQLEALAAEKSGSNNPAATPAGTR